MKHSKSLAILGTASDVGKSITVTALCRIFRDLGMTVAPFKAQNMSNNSFVSLSQGELARAQAVQAEAARTEPTVDMNPVLLKPSGDLVSQVILRGKVIGNKTANSYFSDTSSFKEEAKSSLDRLRSEYDLVIIEGAGSCAEVNLRSRDFTNFEMAHHADAPVLLVADIDRGGVFAQIIGTLSILDQRDRERVKGILINRFRGDPKLFEDGIRYIEEKTKLPVLGLIPYYSDIQIDSEDGLPMNAKIDPPSNLAKMDSIKIGVILLPHISNFTDFLPLEMPEVTDLHYLRRTRSLSEYDLIIIPGSKNVRGDLQWLHDSGWSQILSEHQKNGGRIAGICGGYQILGDKISDPEGIEGDAGETIGLKMLPVETVLKPQKQLHRTNALWTSTNTQVSGYEIHHGITIKTKLSPSPLKVLSRNGVTEYENVADGATSENGKVWGCYLHGLFNDAKFRIGFLKTISKNKMSIDHLESKSTYDFRQTQYDLLANHYRVHTQFDRIYDLLG